VFRRVGPGREGKKELVYTGIENALREAKRVKYDPRKVKDERAVVYNIVR
jgi:hypothetical protein